MDLIYASPNGTDIGVLEAYTFDLAFGSDENNFEITMPITDNVLAEDYIIYIEGTEYGGIVDSIKVNTEQEVITYNGRTWHGLIESKIIRPDNAQDYYIVSGEANSVLSTLIAKLGLSNLFVASTEASGININYQFQRYCKAYTEGILRMLQSVGAKLKVEWKEGMVELSAISIFNYANTDDFDSDLLQFVIAKEFNKINHLICLGSGELAERTVIDLYTDENGIISQTQTYFNMDERVEIFDFPNAESSDDLIEKGIEQFKKLIATDTLEIDLDTEFQYDIGDVVGGYENITKTTVITAITKKIVTITDDIVNTEYKVGGR